MKYTITEQQYDLLVGERKPAKTSLNEGRKDELLNKYRDSYKGKEEILKLIVNDPDLARFKHKYTDFVLRNFINTVLYGIRGNIMDAVETIKNFDKYQSQLEKKDINQYSDINELESVLLPFIEKEKERELESQVKKIYEDSRYLVIIPETKNASCKYGANTKWCVTMKDKNYYESYTSGDQKLYFIIDRKNSTNEYYSKVAVHYDARGYRTVWDSKDARLSQREIEILEYALPEVFEAISEDYLESSFNSEYFNRLFHQVKYQSEIWTSNKNEYKVEVEVGWSELVESDTVSFEVSAYASKYGQRELLGTYYLYAGFRHQNRELFMDFQLETVESLQFHLITDYTFQGRFRLTEDIKILDEEIKSFAARRILSILTYSENLKIITDFLNLAYPDKPLKGLFNRLDSYRVTSDIEPGELSLSVEVGTSGEVKGDAFYMECNITATSVYVINDLYVHGKFTIDKERLIIEFTLEENYSAINLGLNLQEFTHTFNITEDIQEMDKRIKTTVAMEITNMILQDKTKIQKIIDYVNEHR